MMEQVSTVNPEDVKHDMGRKILQNTYVLLALRGLFVTEDATRRLQNKNKWIEKSEQQMAGHQ